MDGRSWGTPYANRTWLECLSYLLSQVYKFFGVLQRKTPDCWCQQNDELEENSSTHTQKTENGRQEKNMK